VPSFLVTPRMSPELRARVLASVSGRARPGAKQRLSALVASLRLFGIVAALSLVALVLHVRQERARQLEQQRAAVLAILRVHGAGLTSDDHKLPEKVEKAVLVQAAPGYGGDWLPAPLRQEGTLAELLSLPTLYLRGPLEVLSRAGGTKQAAAASWTDAFVLCLLEPPDVRTEKALKSKARLAMSGRGMDAHSQVQRIAPLLDVLPLLSADWQARVVTASTAAVLSDYRKLVEAAPFRAAVRAAKARQLLVVLDEPGDPKTAAELDGERPHAVRVVLSNLTDGNVELRFRKQVDPGWLSPATRAEYAAGVDSCALALDLREALGVARGAGP
jgi:hypothetical protein